MGARRKGFVLGALVAAGATIWNAPQSGKRTREQIRETVEGVLFTMLDFPEKVAGARGSVSNLTAGDLPNISYPAASEPASEVDPAPSMEADIVIEAPRPSEITR